MSNQKTEKYIIITQPFFFEDECERITMMFQSGMPRLHLRKPESSIEECRSLISAIPECYHERIILHDHFQLTNEFQLGGVHLNSRNYIAPASALSVSTSCHSVEELKEKKLNGYSRENGTRGQYNYLTLSPIFDSISKKGYQSAFSKEDITILHKQGIIDEHVWALGGITFEKLNLITEEYGFAGGMILGDAWTKCDTKYSGMPIVLTIAGSDTSAGAGIQQDIKTMTNCGCYGTTVVTALTSQNTMGVQGVMPVPAEVVESQLRSVYADLRISAVKIGMIPDINVAQAIVKVLLEERQRSILPIVCDPVMISTSGTRLMSEECQQYIVEHLFPLCTLITPNLPEWNSGLCHSEGSTTAFLVKGGHADGNEMTDTLYIYKEGTKLQFTSPRILSTNLHGTGCTLSSAIACGLAKGLSLKNATSMGKEYITRAIEGGKDLHIGHGNGPLWYQN